MPAPKAFGDLMVAAREPALARRQPDMVQLLVQEAEEARRRAFELIDQHGDPIVAAQDLHAAGESYVLAAREMALRARKAAKAGGSRG
jgi:hypothetical protein